MKKLIFISMVFALGNATSMKQMLEEKKVAKGIWYDDGRIALYRTSAIVEDNIDNKMAFLCPKKFDKALLHKTGSSRQAYCTNDTEIDQLYRNLSALSGNIDTIEPIPILVRDYSADEEDQYIQINGFDVEEQNKIESDLYQFLLGYADTHSSGGTDDDTKLEVSDGATPCFVTRQSSDDEAYSSWYFEVDSPHFTFKREHFHFKGVTYNKMYCDEIKKFENMPRISEEEHSTTDNHVLERVYSAEEDQDIQQIIINGFDVEEQNKIESDLYQFFLDCADTHSLGGTENYTDLKVSDGATPCFVTRQSSDDEAYSSWYFEVDNPDFTFKREHFHFKGVTYNKMYCDEKEKFKTEPRISEEEHSTTDNHVFLLVIEFTIIFIACVASITIVQFCYNTPDKKQRNGKKVKKEMKKTIHV